jgi:peptidoglycan/LPS O-acetylase OafA/YrhL
MKRLSELTVTRNNNFNLIRLSAAIAVLVAHCFPLATGKEAGFAISNYLGISLGSLAVDIFFVTSGFLVTGSLLTNKSALKFIYARILRIYPALLAMLLITTIFLGSYFTKLQWADYLVSNVTHWYFLKNISLITGVNFVLPGVFETNPYKGTVNGSLWTMPYEIWMYGTLVLTWLVLQVASELRLRMFKITVVVFALSSLIAYIAIEPNSNRYYQLIRLFSMFFTGAAYYVLQKRVILSPLVFWLAAMALAASMLDKHIFHIVYSLTLAYMLIYAAYIPTGRIRAFNGFGDYSYGVYIYAFPVQQSVAALIPGISIEGMLLISLSVTFVFAGLSWHFIEKPSLALKAAVSGRHNSQLT